MDKYEQSLYFHLNFQATERIFRKVIHPGLDSLRLVDKNGIPINAPLNSMKQKMFILSPRGVPTRVTNHAYSGQPMRMSRPYSEGLSRIEMPDYYNENTYESSSYGTPQSITPYSSKRNTSNFTRGNRPMVKSKSASSRGYLSSVADEKRYLQSAKSTQSSQWNSSSQGLRLEKEWTDLANSRSLKRNSEIVTHRVDRMYFMTGNSINIKPKYQVDEDELNHLRELSKSRQSSRRQSRHAQFLEPCMEEEEESMCEMEGKEIITLEVDLTQPCEVEEKEIITPEVDLTQPCEVEEKEIITPEVDLTQPCEVEEKEIITPEVDLTQPCEVEEKEIITPEVDLDIEDPYVNVSRHQGIQSVVLDRSEDYTCTRMQSAITTHIGPTVVGDIEDEGGGNENVPVTSQKITCSVAVGTSRSDEVKEPLEHMVNESVVIDSEEENAPTGGSKSIKNSTDERPSSDLTDTIYALSKQLLSPNPSFVSKDSGIQNDQDKNFIEDKVSQNPLEPTSQNDNGENEEKLKFTHWIVDFGNVAVADILVYGKKGTSGESHPTCLKDSYSSVKKHRFGIKTGTELQVNCKKKTTKRQIKTCRNKESRPCLRMANVRTYAVEKPSRNFPNRKTKSVGYRTLHLQPVNCGCREKNGNLHNTLFIEGTSAPFYKVANKAMDGFQFNNS
ncbi:uncharacterized protein LOC125657780 isoform X2 [Ostrea edulis]|uniref:uncharacterized protein LOC125657780 isoform X2 n=1 Tax=Ostrea edulis TaxID=37623 RepID=UPI0024AFEB09|nr:uncharacterized protein LOC125657780 isoform X2 [Ostrea edulis]